jgi:hypothetical protein
MSISPSPLKSPVLVKPESPHRFETVDVIELNSVPVEKCTYTLSPLAEAISVTPSPLKSPGHVYSFVPHKPEHATQRRLGFAYVIDDGTVHVTTLNPIPLENFI